MNREDGCMSNVDVILGQLAQATVPPDVQQRLDARIDEFCKNPQPEKAMLRNAAAVRSRRWFVGASAAASVAFVACAVSFLVLGSRDVWAQVARTLQSKPWVRFTLQIPDGMTAPEGSEPSEHWLSNKHKATASKSGDRADFMDLARHEMYSYFPLTNSVTLTTSRDEQIADFGFIETLRRLVSRDEKRELSFPESAVQIITRTQAEIQEEGRRWTEFKFQCRNARRSPSDYQVTIRVDPESGLPVELRSTEKFSPDHPDVEWTLAIDYPESGPTDIYAMGVPQNAAIIDRRNVKTENGKEIKKFLDAYVAARQKPLEPFSVEIVQEFAGLIVQEEFKIKLPGEFMPDAVGYPNHLMRFGPSPVNNPDCKVTLDRQPALGPQGTVLLHILIETTVGRNDCYYWIAPDKDFLVLRNELHYSGKDHVEWHNSTRIIDKLEQSPEGRWFPSVVRYGKIKKHGDDLSNERVPNDPDIDRDPMKIGPITTTMLRYNVTFTER